MRAVTSLALSLALAAPAAGYLASLPLHGAAREGNTATVTALVDAGTDPNAADDDGNTPLHHAAYFGHTDTAAALLDAGADPNVAGEDGNTPLLLAESEGHTATAALCTAGGRL